MKDFTIELCNSSSDSLDVHTAVSMHNGRIDFDGDDTGPRVEEFFDVDQFEYHYNFDEENTKKLIACISETGKNPEDSLIENFSGLDGFVKLRELCEEKGIAYEYISFRS